LTLGIELLADLREREDGENRNGYQGATNEKHKYAACHLAAKGCRANFHELKLYQYSRARAPYAPTLARKTS
jgi:hypothetical protein